MDEQVKGDSLYSHWADLWNTKRFINSENISNKFILLQSILFNTSDVQFPNNELRFFMLRR